MDQELFLMLLYVFSTNQEKTVVIQRELKKSQIFQNILMAVCESVGKIIVFKPRNALISQCDGAHM